MARSNVHNTKISYLSGYQTVPESSADGKIPSPCGTEEANEGDPKDEGALGWACRSFDAGPMAYAVGAKSDEGETDVFEQQHGGFKAKKGKGY